MSHVTEARKVRTQIFFKDMQQHISASLSERLMSHRRAWTEISARTKAMLQYHHLVSDSHTFPAFGFRSLPIIKARRPTSWEAARTTATLGYHASNSANEVCKASPVDHPHHCRRTICPQYLLPLNLSKQYGTAMTSSAQDYRPIALHDGT